MRHIGTRAYGVRLPVINPGDPLAEIVLDAVLASCAAENLQIGNTDILGVTEAVVAKAQNNYATTDDIAADVRELFGNGTVGVVFPILSRNRFLNILKGIAKGADEVAVLLAFPHDEQGNPLIDMDNVDLFAENRAGKPGPFSAEEYREMAGNFVHPFTGIDYIELYENSAPNIKVYVSDDPRDILKITKNVLVGEVHTRFRTKNRLLRAGAERVFTLSDVLNRQRGDSGFNPDYGVLGSNISSGDRLKLFPRDCGAFVDTLRRGIFEKTGANPEVLVYGDGAFKDPLYGIWELADPVVSPAHTERLGGQPSELKFKYIADNMFAELTGEEQSRAITEYVRNKSAAESGLREGTTPRRYADLVGSLCDLMSGSGDKGTPVILIKGYFDDYSAE